MKPILPSEHDSQVAFATWWELYSRAEGLETNLGFAVPNGGSRHIVVAVKLKAEGVRAGVPDFFIDIPSGGFYGLRLEFKRKPNKPSAEQIEWIAAARKRGYNVCVVYSTDEAIQCATGYLNQLKRVPPKYPLDA